MREDVKTYVEEYVDWVSTNVPSGLEWAFGVGIVSENRFGTYWGFKTDDANVWGDFICLVKGSEFEQVQEFAERIPDLFEKGMEEIKKQNERLENVKLKEVKL